MIIKLMKVFYFNCLLLFVVGFCHFVVVKWLHWRLDSSLYLFILFFNVLIILKINRKKINKNVVKIFIFIPFLIVLLLYSVFIKFLSYAIFYNIYILLEFLFLGFIFSNINYIEFKKIILQYRNAYLIVHIPLFFLYIIDILNIHDFPNRFIVFDNYRFGGFVSEPRGLAIFTMLAILSIFLVKRKKYQKLEITFFILVLYSTFSNSVILALFLFPFIFFFFKSKIYYKLLYLELIIPFSYFIWHFLPEYFSIGRFTFDKDSLIYIFSNLANIKDIDVGRVNALNVRLWIFLKGIFDINWYGLGFESMTNIAILNGLPQSDAIGIVTILTDFGYIIGGIIICYLIYIINKYKYIDKNIFIFLVGLFLLLFMSPPYAKFYILFYVYYFVLFQKTKKEILQCNYHQ